MTFLMTLLTFFKFLDVAGARAQLLLNSFRASTICSRLITTLPLISAQGVTLEHADVSQLYSVSSIRAKHVYLLLSVVTLMRYLHTAGKIE